MYYAASWYLGWDHTLRNYLTNQNRHAHRTAVYADCKGQGATPDEHLAIPEDSVISDQLTQGTYM